MSAPSTAGQDAPPALRHALGASPTTAMFQWPWDIASRGGSYFSQMGDVVNALTSAGHAVVGSSSGPGIVAAVASGPTDPANADQVLGNSLFGPALAAVKADQLLRSAFVGWATGAQVGLFGGGGGAGVASDVVDPGSRSGVRYGLFKIGVGAQIATGLLVGAMTRAPNQLNDSTAVFEFGASLVGIGAFVSVIMSDADLALIGFTVNLGVGGGFSSSTGYGSIST